MNRGSRTALALILVSFFLILAGWLLLPRLIWALPGQITGRLPEEVVDLVTTPLPTALPVPAGADTSKAEEIVVPQNRSTRSEVTPTAPPTERPSPTRVTAQETDPVSPISTPAFSPSPTIQPSPTATDVPLPERVVIDGVRVIPQKFNNCGPANLSMVMSFYGHQRDQLEVGGAIKPNYDDRNVSPEELIRYVNEETPLHAAWYGGGDNVTLKRLLAGGYPVIVEKGLFLEEKQGWMGHYLTIYGYDDIEKVFLSHDTFLGPWDNSGRPIDYEFLEERWSHFNFTFLLVYSSDQENDLAEILGPDMMKPELMWQNAALKAREMSVADPNNAYAWFNLGSSLTYLAELTGDDDLFHSAAVAFDEAFTLGLPWRMLWYQFNPYVAYLASGRIDDVLSLTEVTLTNHGGQEVEETYLYRGHALLASGEISRAKDAYDQASRLNPNFIPAHQALEELEAVD